MRARPFALGGLVRRADAALSGAAGLDFFLIGLRAR
jgi:hypothetical protein